MKIAIFGGSFNPIHKGHINIAEHAIKELNLDKLIFVPAHRSPFKKKVEYVGSEHRVNMINLVKPEKSEVSDFELKRKGVSYTIDTIKYFKQKYPNDKIYLLIGSDNLSKLPKWKDLYEIVSLAQIAVFKRDKKYSKENIKRYSCMLLNNDILEASSSAFKNGDFSSIHKEVNKYIGKNALYIPELMLGMLDPKRHKHSVSVANYAARFAKAKKVDAKRAWIAGALHDITKTWSNEKHREFIERYTDKEFEDYELHSISGYYWVQNRYMLDDEEIAQAILRHTSLGMELTDMDKVLFAADKLAVNRFHPGIQKDRQLMIDDFDAGFRKIVEIVYGILLEKRDLRPKQRELFMELINK